MALVAAPKISVSDVKVFSGYPWKDIIFSYTISQADTALGDESLVVQVTDHQSGRVTGDLVLEGANLSDGRHAVKWDAQAAGFKFRSSNVDFTLKCVWKPDLFCIVDLSGGPSATKYPVTFHASEPEGGFLQDLYKTKKLVLRRIEKGSFYMGGGSGDSTRRTTISKPFYLGLFEVTKSQYACVMGGTVKSGEELRPVEVDYPGGFMGALRSRTGLLFDLPTEAQWEFACRAGTTTKFDFGNSTAGYGQYMWCQENSGNRTHDVGTKACNRWGFYDMYGNAAELCLNWYSETPTYGTDPRGPSSGTYRVVRGGYWNTPAAECDASYRGTYGMGFRVARGF